MFMSTVSLLGGGWGQRSEVNAGIRLKSHHVSDVKMPQAPTFRSCSWLLLHVCDGTDGSVLDDPPLEPLPPLDSTSRLRSS